MRCLILRRLFAGAASFLAFVCLTGVTGAQQPTLPPDARVVTTPADNPVWQRDGSDGGRFVGGLGVFVVKPYFESNRAFSRVDVPAVGPVSNTSIDFSSNLTLSPRFWVGYVAEGGWGVRVNGWFFDQSSSNTGSLTGADFLAGSGLTSASPGGIAITTPTLTLVGGAGTDVLTATTRLRLSVVDIEATKGIDVGRGTILITGGARLARLEQFYNASIFNTANDPAVVSQTLSLTSSQRFTGAGPTISFQGECPLGKSNFGVYATIRGAVLAGRYESSTTSSSTTTLAGVAATIPGPSSFSPRDAVVPVGSIELGVEWKGCWGRSQPLVRVGAFGESYGSVFNNNNSGGTPNTSSLNGNLSFVGFTVAAGLRY